ncbi:SDR family oxidoreductase [bacterium]|nr:SDR family oxidoreductase [bacterium]
MPSVDLNNKVAIVTGAAQGMGRAIAEMLSAKGAQVAVVDTDENKAISVAERIKGVAITADVSKSEDVNNMIKIVMERFGNVDILVNNAGIVRTSRIENIDYDEWKLVLDVNLNGVFLCTKAVLGIMNAQQFGRIVNISSSAGRSVSTLGGAHYTTSKAGVLGFTRAVAKEVAPFGITVNAICPGLIDTEMVHQHCSPEQTQAYLNSFPIPRLGTPEEVAQLVCFLVSEAAYITGASIDINGGDLMI